MVVKPRRALKLCIQPKNDEMQWRRDHEDDDNGDHDTARRHT